jgi:magnesium transporter
VVTFDDIAEIIEEEASEDILYMAGVAGDQDSPSTPALLSLRRRLPWLIMNLGTGLISSMVISQFEGTIDRVKALAALMPIVAGMGGNAAVQSIAVMVRSIALGDLGSGGKMRAVIKEGTVGLMNGTAIGLIAGSIVWAMWGELGLGALIAVAMFVNLIIAALVGTTIPLMLRRLKLDPALSSGPLATTFTDVCGFLLFLGLATLTLHWLLT